MLFVNDMEDGELKNYFLNLFESFDDLKQKHDIVDDIKRTLTWLIRAASKAMRMDQGLTDDGYPTNPYGDIFNDLSDAIYHLIGECSHHFEDSLTYIVLHTDAITDDSKVQLLLNVYRKNRSALA